MSGTECGEMQEKAELMRTMLEMSVPMWIDRLKCRSWEHIQSRARECSQIIGEKGDVLMFRGRRGETAEAFNRLSEGLACLSFSPGGVEFIGLKFEASREGGEEE